MCAMLIINQCIPAYLVVTMAGKYSASDVFDTSASADNTTGEGDNTTLSSGEGSVSPTGQCEHYSSQYVGNASMLS